MPLTRRSMVTTLPLAAASLAPAPILAAVRQDPGRLPRQPTPEATPGSVPPDPAALLDALLATPVTSTLFPADTSAITVVEWVDASDADLDGAVGGVILQTGEDDNGNIMGPGVYIVHESPDAARAVFDAQLADSDAALPQSILDFPGVVVRDSGEAEPTGADSTFPASTLVVLVVGPVIVSAIGEGDDRLVNDARALANLAGMLDHLRLVRDSVTIGSATG